MSPGSSPFKSSSRSCVSSLSGSGTAGTSHSKESKHPLHISREIPDNCTLLRNQMVRLSPIRQVQRSKTSRRFSKSSYISPCPPRSESVHSSSAPNSRRDTIVTPLRKSKPRNRDDFVRMDMPPRTGRSNNQPTLLPRIQEEPVLIPSACVHNSF